MNDPVVLAWLQQAVAAGNKQADDLKAGLPYNVACYASLAAHEKSSRPSTGCAPT